MLPLQTLNPKPFSLLPSLQECERQFASRDPFSPTCNKFTFVQRIIINHVFHTIMKEEGISDGFLLHCLKIIAESPIVPSENQSKFFNWQCSEYKWQFKATILASMEHCITVSGLAFQWFAHIKEEKEKKKKKKMEGPENTYRHTWWKCRSRIPFHSMLWQMTELLPAAQATMHWHHPEWFPSKEMGKDGKWESESLTTHG